MINNKKDNSDCKREIRKKVNLSIKTGISIFASFLVVIFLNQASIQPNKDLFSLLQDISFKVFPVLTGAIIASVSIFSSYFTSFYNKVIDFSAFNVPEITKEKLIALVETNDSVIKEIRDNTISIIKYFIANTILIFVYNYRIEILSILIKLFKNITLIEQLIKIFIITILILSFWLVLDIVKAIFNAQLNYKKIIQYYIDYKYKDNEAKNKINIIKKSISKILNQIIALFKT